MVHFIRVEVATSADGQRLHSTLALTLDVKKKKKIIMKETPSPRAQFVFHCLHQGARRQHVISRRVCFMSRWSARTHFAAKTCMHR